ncbi:ferritin-like domain-containing protein [Arenimonas sp. MALMAid1274]|uniref:ferritin-like domain-containing protein n=1 Tax=Arenimonas sp. MALMAid1274 TaxID=3411630 RepID=UPI003BA1F909
MSNKTANTLNDLVEALNDGIAFYDHAAKETQDASHQDLFRNMSRLKSIIAADLKTEVARQGETPANDSSWLGEFRQGYADLKAKLAKDPDATYVAALEAQEDRVLHAFRDAVDGDQPARVRELASTYLPQVRDMHDRMRALKQAKQA